MDLARAGALEQEGIGAAARLSEKGFRPPPPAEKGLLAEPSLKISHSCLTNTNHARETQHKKELPATDAAEPLLLYLGFLLNWNGLGKLETERYRNGDV